MKPIAKILRRHARNLREIYRNIRHGRPKNDGPLPAQTILVGLPGDAASVPALSDVRSADGPFPISKVLSWQSPKRSQAADVVLTTECLDADPARAVEQILRVLDHAAYRLILTAASPKTREQLDTLQTALDARGSGRVAQILPVRARHTTPDHVIVVKRRIEHLVLVAGPSAAGKSSLIKQFVKSSVTNFENDSQNVNAARYIARHMDITLGRHWAPIAYAKHLHEISAPRLDRLLLQYDFSRPARLHWARNESDPVLEILESASRTSAITLWTPPERLRQQARQRDRKLTRLPRRSRRASKTARYADPAHVLHMYDNFLQEIEGRVDDHCLIEVNTSIQIYDANDWQRLRASAAA